MHKRSFRTVVMQRVGGVVVFGCAVACVPHAASCIGHARCLAAGFKGCWPDHLVSIKKDALLFLFKLASLGSANSQIGCLRSLQVSTALASAGEAGGNSSLLPLVSSVPVATTKPTMMIISGGHGCCHNCYGSNCGFYSWQHRFPKAKDSWP